MINGDILKNDKYELTDIELIHNGHILHRIKALDDFLGVNKDDIGGFIESDSNLSMYGSSWIYDDAKIFDDAKLGAVGNIYNNVQIFENAYVDGIDVEIHNNVHVYGKSRISGNAKILDNVHIYGNAKISENAIVSGNAKISENAIVSGNAKISGNAFIHGSIHIQYIENISGNVDIIKYPNRIKYVDNCNINSISFPYQNCTWNYIKALAEMSVNDLVSEYNDKQLSIVKVLSDWHDETDMPTLENILTHIFDLEDGNVRYEDSSIRYENIIKNDYLRYYLTIQEYLIRKYNSSYITLYRGTPLNNIQNTEADLNFSMSKLSNVTSWTSDRYIAESFGELDEGVLITAHIPIKSIFELDDLAHNLAIHDMGIEHQYIIMGNDFKIISLEYVINPED